LGSLVKALQEIRKGDMTTTTVRRPVVVDIDDHDAAVFADRFLPPDAQTSVSSVLGVQDDDWTEVKRNILGTIKMNDHAFFAKHPGRWEYIRELLPGEFEIQLEPPPLGKRWMVKVTAFRDHNKKVMLRIREGILLSAAT
jgi:hypothetical protein